MSLKKLTATITAICFVYTGVVFPAVQAAASPRAPGGGFKETLDGLMIPATVGRVTGAKYFGSGTVVINIQDLHCHPEVQKNISRILEELDAKYPLNEVYLEGGYGNIDTAWLSGLRDESFRKDLAETMLNEGRLTGAEYYAAMKNRPHLLKGIEDEEMHRGNIVRLGKMLEKKEDYLEKVKLLDRDLEFMEAKYFSDRNRRFNRIIGSFREGKLSAEKYYRMLWKYAGKINEHPDSYNNVFSIDMERYPNIKGYLELLALGKRLDYRRISRQLQGFVRVLKERLPFGTYKYLLEKTENFSELDKLYVALAKMRREYNLDLRADFPDLEKFFAYVEKGQEVNPVGMIGEEKRLVEEIRIGFARDVSELEVSFAADFYGYFKDYLFNRLAADDHLYFTERIGKFKEIWGKYTYVNRLKEMDGEFALLDEYYRVNEERNRVFLAKILPEAGGAAGKEDGAGEDIYRTLESLAESPEIVVVITGGFHTEGLQALLDEKKVTHVSITPNVTQDTKTSSAVYEDFAKRQANIEFRHSDALALTVASCQPGMERFKPAAEVLWKKISKGDAGKIEAQLRELMAEMGIEGMDIAVDGRYITFKGAVEARIDRKTGRFEERKEARQKPMDGYLAAIGKLAAGDAELVANITIFLAKWVSLIGLRELITDILLAGSKWAADNNLTVGDGLIHEIARDGRLQELIAKYEGMSADELGKLDPVLQKIIAFRAERQERREDAGAAQAVKNKKKSGIKKIIMPGIVLVVLLGSMLFPAKALAASAAVNAAPSSAVNVTMQAGLLDDAAVRLVTNERSSRELLKELEALKSEFARNPVTSEVQQDANGVLSFADPEAAQRAAQLQAKALEIYAQMQKEGIRLDGEEYIDKERYGTEAYDVRRTLIVWAILSPDTFEILADKNKPIYVDTMKDGETGGMGINRDGERIISINSKLYDNKECGDLLAALVIAHALPGIDNAFEDVDVRFAGECGVDIAAQTRSADWVFYVLGAAGIAALAVAVNKSGKNRAGSGRTAGQRKRTISAEEIKSAIDHIDTYAQRVRRGAIRGNFDEFDWEMQENSAYKTVSRKLRNIMEARGHSFYPADFLGQVRDALRQMLLDREMTNEKLNRFMRDNADLFMREKLYDYLKAKYDLYANSRGTELHRLIQDLLRGYNDLKFSHEVYAESMDSLFVYLYKRISGKADLLIGFSMSDKEYIELILETLKDFDLRKLDAKVDQKWRARRDAGYDREQRREGERYTSGHNSGSQGRQERRSGSAAHVGAYDPDGKVHDFGLSGISDEDFERNKDKVIRRCLSAFLAFYELFKKNNDQKYTAAWTPEKEAEIVAALENCRTAGDLEKIDIRHIVTMYRLMVKAYHPDSGNGVDAKIMPQLNSAYEFLTKGRDRNGGASMALMPGNVGRYLQGLLRGRPAGSVRWGVHLRELLPLLFTSPASFDRMHGEANDAREQAARAMQRSFWASMIPGIALTLGGIFGLVPAALILGILGAGVMAGIAISGILHVRYDMQAALPMAFFVTRDPAALDAEKLDPKQRGYAPVVITSVSKLEGSVKNTGIKIQGRDVWTSVDRRGVLTVYVAGESEEFARNASEVISILKGYGNLRGSGRAVRVLEDTVGQALNAARAVVFDYTNGVRSMGEWGDIPVLDGKLAIEAGYGAIVNAHNAEQWPREIAFERSWSDEFGTAVDRLNNSLVLSMADLDRAGTDKIWSLKKKGAKIYVRYTGSDIKELAGKVKAYGLDGVICSELSANADELARAAGNPELWVAGPNITGETARKYEEMDLLKDKGKLGSIKAYTVVKVTLGKGYTLEDVLALNRLPATCIIVFDGASFVSDTAQPSRDVTLLGTFGVNILELLQIAPVSREEKEEYERRVAYRLDMGEFEAPGDLETDIESVMKGEIDGIYGNATFLEAVKLHLLGTPDEELKSIFLGAVAERMRARARLAALETPKANGLADEELERLYGELLAREDKNTAADNGILTKLALFAGEHNTGEVFAEFMKTTASLKDRKDDPQAISTLIKLIELYGDPKYRMDVNREDNKITNLRAVRGILEAA